MSIEVILSILKGHGIYVGQKWTFKPIDLKEAATEIEQIINDRPDEWISVEERLPEIGESVILFADHGDSQDIYNCHWTAEAKKYHKMNHITHWQQHKFPSPPKQ